MDSHDLKAQTQSLAEIRRQRARSTPAKTRKTPTALPPPPDGRKAWPSGSPADRLASVVHAPSESFLSADPELESPSRWLGLADSGSRPLEENERRRLEQECRVHLLSSQQLQHELEELQQKCARLEAELKQEVQRRRQAEERHSAEAEALEASLRNTHAQGLKEQQQAWQAVEVSVSEKEGALASLASVAMELQQLALELHQAFREQQAGFAAFVAATRQQLKDLQPAQLLHEKLLTDLSSQLQQVQTASRRQTAMHKAELQGMKEMVQSWRKEADSRSQKAEDLGKQVRQHQERQERRARRAEDLRVKDQIHMVKDLGIVMKGVDVALIAEDSSVRKCTLRIEFESWPGMLVWLDERGNRVSSCQLTAINLIAYGFASKAWTLAKASAENCFSVHTHTSSSWINFACTGDAQTFSILPVLSRLCAHVQGWPVGGSFSSRSQLVRAHAWCKVQKSFQQLGVGNFCTYLLAKLGRHRLRLLPGSATSRHAAQPGPGWTCNAFGWPCTTGSMDSPDLAQQ